ncbi:protein DETOXIFICATION 29-like isoform X2 [Rosa rugosa]|uniref:protein DETOXIFICATION 29-like isoform X2 n=1 Tax=Rosa rugosa TaxID=74645 RepID=UPI002B40B507|nr:protein DETOXIFICATION 29-like isoform X2 [Rosa rugosa]
MEENKQPLLSPRDEVVGVPQHHQPMHDNLDSFPAPANPSFISSTTFNPDSDDIPPINGVRDFFREFNRESKKLWFLAGPAIFTSLCQYSLGAVTQVFAGQVSTLDLAAVSIENSVIAGFCFGALLGMGSALETLCGQAVGAGLLDMLGIYMQRSWVILNATSVVLCFLYIFAQQILYGIGQTAAISKAAGVFAIYMIPQLFAYAMVFPLAKFLQSQSKMMVMAVIAAVTLILHTVFSWLLMLKLGWGLVGAAVVLNASWWIIVVSQMVYIFSGTCGRAWTGFSWKAFHGLWAFVKLSLASAVMLWLRHRVLPLPLRPAGSNSTKSESNSSEKLTLDISFSLTIKVDLEPRLLQLPAAVELTPPPPSPHLEKQCLRRRSRRRGRASFASIPLQPTGEQSSPARFGSNFRVLRSGDRWFLFGPVSPCPASSTVG